MKYLISIILLVSSATSWATPVFDFVNCRNAPVLPNETLVGLAVPSGSGDYAQASELETHLAQIGASRTDITVCSEEWSQLLPSVTPATNSGLDDVGYGWVVLALSALFALLIMNLTPRHWRRHLTLTGLVAYSGLTYFLMIISLWLGSQFSLPQKLIYGDHLFIQSADDSTGQWHPIAGVREMDELLLIFVPQEKNQIAPKDADATNTAESPIGKTHQVIQPLNFRNGPGIQHSTLRNYPLPKGLTVTVIGPLENDWWKVKLDDGSQGWVNSLWLR